MDRRPVTDQSHSQPDQLRSAKASSLDVFRTASSSQSQAARPFDHRLDQPPHEMGSPRLESLDVLRDQTSRQEPHSVNPGQPDTHVRLYTAMRAFRDPAQQLYLTDNVERLAKHLEIPKKRLSDGLLGWTSVDVSTLSEQERDQALLAGRSLSHSLLALQDGQGAIHLTDNLTRFATDNSLSGPTLSKVLKGPQTEHQGWRSPDEQTLTHLREQGYSLK